MLSQGSTNSEKKKEKTLRAKSHYDVGLVATFQRYLHSLTLNSSFKVDGSVAQTNTTAPYFASGIIKWVFHCLVYAQVGASHRKRPNLEEKKNLTCNRVFILA